MKLRVGSCITWDRLPSNAVTAHDLLHIGKPLQIYDIVGQCCSPAHVLAPLLSKSALSRGPLKRAPWKRQPLYTVLPVIGSQLLLALIKKYLHLHKSGPLDSVCIRSRRA
jgi:hypothetical protein